MSNVDLCLSDTQGLGSSLKLYAGFASNGLEEGNQHRDDNGDKERVQGVDQE